MTNLEKKVRELLPRLELPLVGYKSYFESTFSKEDVYEMKPYRDTVHAQNLIKEIENELEALAEKEGSSKKFNQKKLF